MPARYSDVTPSRHHGPERQHENENLFDWIRRQANPVKPKRPRTEARKTTFEAAVAEMVNRKKKDAEAVAAAESRRPTDPSEGI